MTNETVDTSVVVAGLCSWHPDHQAAKAVLASQPRAVAHVLLESYSVLTRLPAPQRLDPALVVSALARAFPSKPVGLSPGNHAALLRRLASEGISGGATYDALVAEAARTNHLTLHTLDVRARPTYEALGVTVRWVNER